MEARTSRFRLLINCVHQYYHRMCIDQRSIFTFQSETSAFQIALEEQSAGQAEDSDLIACQICISPSETQ